MVNIRPSFRRLRSASRVDNQLALGFEIMKCKECVKENLKSQVSIGSTTTTCMGYNNYYDEDGKYHFHNPNIVSTEMRCTNGHTWSEKSKPSCWCGWKN